MTKQEFIEYLGERLTYEDIEKADAETKAYVKGFIEGLDAKPEPLGEWIDNDGDTYCCSNCGAEAPIDEWEYKYRDKIRSERTKFCPNCGARMVK